MSSCVTHHCFRTVPAKLRYQRSVLLVVYSVETVFPKFVCHANGTAPHVSCVKGGSRLVLVHGVNAPQVPVFHAKT